MEVTNISIIYILKKFISFFLILGKGSCFDDGGGAVFVRDLVGGKNKFVVAGLVGYSVGCARAGKFYLFHIGLIILISDKILFVML